MTQVLVNNSTEVLSPDLEIAEKPDNQRTQKTATSNVPTTRRLGRPQSPSRDSSPATPGHNGRRKTKWRRGLGCNNVKRRTSKVALPGFVSDKRRQSQILLNLTLVQRRGKRIGLKLPSLSSVMAQGVGHRTSQGGYSGILVTGRCE